MDRVTLLGPVTTRRGLLKGGIALAGLAALGTGPANLLRYASAQTSVAMALQLGWFANAQMAGEFTAIGKGYFKDAGVDVKIVPGGPSIDPVGVFFLRGKGIRTPADFIGKNIGIQATARPLLDAVLAKYNVPRDKVNVIIIGGTTTPLLTGQVDVITGWVINYAQNLPIEGRADHFLLWDLGIKQYAYTYFTTDQVYNTRKDVLGRYISAAAKS